MAMKRILFSMVLVVFVVASADSQQGTISPAMAALADAERAFARTSVEKGIGPAFYEFFAEEGVGFNPHPAKFRENYRKRQPPAERPPVTLDWWPVFGDVSAAGDLGYTTGPYVFTDQSPQKRRPFYGFYSSIWKKQADGTWRMMVDLGVDTPEPNPQLPRDQFRQARAIAAYKSAASGPESLREDVLRAEGEFLKTVSARGLRNAYATYLADECRIHRDGRFPVVGKDAALALFSDQGVKLEEWETLDGGVAASGDFGYTYGRYTLNRSSDTKPGVIEKGYFMRVWRRDARGAWKLTFDVGKGLPPETK
jgi:ketosteroid isomerase-like protein